MNVSANIKKQEPLQEFKHGDLFIDNSVCRIYVLLTFNKKWVAIPLGRGTKIDSWNGEHDTIEQATEGLNPFYGEITITSSRS